MRLSAAVCSVLCGAAVSLSAQNLPSSTPKPFSLLRCTPLPAPWQMHGAAVVGQRLYVMGGIRNVGGWTTAVVSAPILAGGTLGSWREERPLPENRSYISQSVEVVNDRIYIIGGATAPTTNTLEENLQRANDVLWTRVQSDGTLGEWQRSQPFTMTPTSCIATSSNDKHLFVLGGRTQEGISDKVFVCDLGQDGSPQHWRATSPLPTPLWFHGAAILEDRLYVWGGLTQPSKDAINPKVFSALVREDGAIGPWQEETPMPAATYSSAFCGFNDYLVGVAGRYQGAVYTNAIWYTRLHAGRLGAWAVLNTDLEARVYHALGLDKIHGYVYITGGQYKDINVPQGAMGRLLANVQAFQITQPRQQRLEVQPTAPSAASSPPPTASNAPAVQPLDLASAQERARRTGQKILVLFYSPEVPACKRFWDEVVSQPAFSRVTHGYHVAVCDVSRQNQTDAARYSIFKVPAAVILDPRGTVVKSTLRLRTLEDVRALLGN